MHDMFLTEGHCEHKETEEYVVASDCEYEQLAFIARQSPDWVQRNQRCKTNSYRQSEWSSLPKMKSKNFEKHSMENISFLKN